MTDDRELDGLDPYDLLDEEAARLDEFFSSRPEDAWAERSRCAEWTVRDLLGHLAATEEYHHACLSGTVDALFTRMLEAGVTDLHSANAKGVADRAALSGADVLAEWRQANAWTRAQFRAHDGADIATSIGPYPCRWQAFHVASELATHADDAGVPVTPDERGPRLAWRTRFSRFALAESKPEVNIESADGRTTATDGTIVVEVGDDVLVEAVAGRYQGTDLSTEARALLSTAP